MEGPQCHLKARQLAAAGVVGQRVTRARSGDAKLAARLTAAGPILRIAVVGKECFCVFADCALRLHYGMSGSQIVRSGPDRPLPLGSRKILTLTLELEHCAVDLYDCGTPSVRTLGYLATVEARKGQDVIAKEFDRRAVMDLLRADTRSAFDALMDQTSFPGVGNVIKCEGLHEACVSPTIVLSELPDSRLGLLVDVVRAFAQRWHEACRRGSGIAKRVYGATACSCGAQVGLVRAGEKNRITYFCPSCQSRGASLTPSIAPRGDSLLGWLRHKSSKHAGRPADTAGGLVVVVDLEHGAEEDPPRSAATRVDAKLEWACAQCTLLNAAAARCCAACRGPREAGAAGGGSGDSSGSTARAQKRPPPSPPAGATPSKRPAHATAVGRDGLRLAAPGCRCSLAGKLQRVRKAGPNHGRLFWSCPKHQSQSCGVFIWADDRFPSCRCPPDRRRKALLRRVLKPGPTNGRYFFSCAHAKQGCGFFSWESDHDCWDCSAAPVALPL